MRDVLFGLDADVTPVPVFKNWGTIHTTFFVFMFNNS